MHTLEAPPAPVDILIAEDDPDFRAGLRLLFENRGYTCVEAGNGREAVEIARQSSPQWVFLDLMMPELDGFSVARQLRADPRTKAARIHCLTGRKDQAALQRARLAGCELILTKPVDVGTLMAAVNLRADSMGDGWVDGLTLREAEDLLDWLEANGYPPAEFGQGKEGFAVRCPWSS
jgi:CheY-like chemotaxis protein